MQVHRTRRGAAPTKSGFTLAEVLVTVLIMGGIMVSITQILHTARISRDTIHNIQETQLAGPAIMDMIERDLRGLMIYNRTRQDHMRVQNRVMLCRVGPVQPIGDHGLLELALGLRVAGEVGVGEQVAAHPVREPG